MPQFFVYELIDPRIGRPFYVGKGSEGRIEAHEREARSGAVSAKCDKIREIWAAGFCLSYRIVRKFTDEAAAYQFEAGRIEKIGLANLTNVVPGGRGGYLESPAKDDRKMARAFAKIIWKTRGFTYLPRLRLGGTWHDLPDNFNDIARGLFLDLVDRRGMAWVQRAAGLR